MFDAIAFAGGGNRCYWQGGFYEALAERRALAPRLAVGASAGAWQAAYSLLGLGDRVRPLVVEGCRQGLPNLDWRRRHGTLFPVAPLYRSLVAHILDEGAFARLNALCDLRVAISRAPRALPGALAPAVGIAAYQIEKKLRRPVHPRFGRALGFRPEFLSSRAMSTPATLVDAIMASATVPPFMPVLRLGGRVALDGGLVDNVPVDPLVDIEREGGRTLVLLSRRYHDLPRIQGRIYAQPSETIRLGQFDITNPDAILAAHALGRRDGAAFAAALA